MFHLLTIFGESRRHKFLLRPSLDQEGAPSFQTLPAQNDDFAIYAREDLDTTISGTVIETKKRETEYYCCSITLAENVEISNNYAFGSGMAGGSGGALFVSYSVLMGTGPSTFTHNSASVGGALCFTASKVYLKDPTFNGNTAFKYGGGVYFQGVFQKDLKYSTEHVYNQEKGEFKGNTAGEIGGGIAFSNAGECSYFYDTKFNRNKCTLNGGAVYAINAPLQFYSCIFDGNVVGSSIITSENKDPTSIKWNSDEQIEQKRKWGSSRFRARGGGAICFVSDSHAEGLSQNSGQSNRRLYTQECCFVNNKANFGSSFGEGAGHVVLLDGFSFWISHIDSIPILESLTADSALKQSDFFSLSNRDIGSGETKSNPYAWFYALNQHGVPSNVDACNGNEGSYSESSSNGYSSEYTPGIISGSETYSGSITDIPAPTTFVYQATPITQLPYKTTSSYSTYPTANEGIYSSPSRRTIRATAIATPDLTFSPSLANTPEFTVSPSISQSNIAHIIPSYDPDQSTTITLTLSWSYTFGTSFVPVTVTDSNGNPSISYSQINTDFMTEIPIEVTTNLAISDQVDPEDDSNLMIIIGAAVGGLILLIIIAIVIFFILTRKKDSDSSSTVEMAEETILNLPDSNSAIVTKDNPLWTTSVLGESDDPFHNDFEEVVAAGFFRKEEL